ncbi:uncharacterized protein [Dermacentor albipictus]|uniref:uncharacterized protein n=1 Tax=Dermacentor albipictus TaxID=60249 RepID=UPI0031FC820E
MTSACFLLTLVIITAHDGIMASTDVPTTVADVTTSAAATIGEETTSPSTSITSAVTTAIPGEPTTTSSTEAATNAGTSTLPGDTSSSSAGTTTTFTTSAADNATTVTSIIITNGATTAGPGETTTISSVDATTTATTTPYTTTVTTPSTQGSCVEATLPDVIGLSKCLGNSLNLCAGDKTVGEGLMTVASCTATSVFNNLSPQNALYSLRVMLVAFVNKFSTFLGRSLDIFLSALSPSGSVRDAVCHGEIRLGFPSSYGKCLNETLKLCKNGTLINVSFVQSLIAGNMCFMKETITTSPLDMTRTFFCNILRGAKALFGNIFFIGPIMYDQLYNAVCI